jgi:(R,R)-butanediol dehydrogenase/meso-butanediol dehydrogenase/diacetyl reductase
MRAARLHGPGDLRIDELPVPDPGPGEVRLRVAFAGLCGTDVHYYFAGPTRDATIPHPLTGATLPQVLGHEFAGTVDKIGDEVTGVAVGDRACVEPLYTCGKCDRCLGGYRHLCRLIGTHGLSAPGGGLAEYTVVPAKFLHALPENLSLADGALVEPMAVALNGVLRAGVRPGGTAAIFGCGPIGLGVLLGLRATGVRDVFVIEPSPARAAIARRLGAAVFDSAAEDPIRAVLRETGGRGVDAAFECAGVAASFAAAPQMIAPRGRVVVMALFEKEVALRPNLVFLPGEVEMVGSRGYAAYVFEKVIGLIAAGHYPQDGWVEHIGLDAVRDGLERLRRGAAMKLVVDLP